MHSSYRDSANFTYSLPLFLYEFDHRTVHSTRALESKKKFEHLFRYCDGLPDAQTYLLNYFYLVKGPDLLHYAPKVLSLIRDFYFLSYNNSTYGYAAQE